MGDVTVTFDVDDGRFKRNLRDALMAPMLNRVRSIAPDAKLMDGKIVVYRSWSNGRESLEVRVGLDLAGGQQRWLVRSWVRQADGALDHRVVSWLPTDRVLSIVAEILRNV